VAQLRAADHTGEVVLAVCLDVERDECTLIR
jgi:hypothetical protein